MDRNVFSYANAFLKGRGCHLYGSVLTEGGGSRKSLFLAWRMLTACHYQKQSMFVNKDRLGGNGEKKCLPLPKATFFPMAAQHSQLSQDHRPEMQTQTEGWDVSEGKTNWRVKIAVVQGSCAPLIPKVLFSTLHPSHTHTDGHTHAHTHKRAHIPTQADSHQL